MGLTNNRVEVIVAAAEENWVLYFFRSLLRVCSSMVQALLVGGMAVLMGVGDDEEEACSVRLAIVIPETPPWKATATM